MIEVRKTIRFEKKDVDKILEDSDLYIPSRYHNYGNTFSDRLRNLVEIYFWQKERIGQLEKEVENYRESADERARLSDRYQSDEGYPKETK